MMSQTNATDILNHLLAAEHESILPRLAEADPNITWPATDDRTIVARMQSDSVRHERELTQLILQLRGAPVSRRAATATGSVHFLNLDYLMPSVIADVKQLVATYESAGTTGNREADALISRNANDYQAHLSTLEKIRT